VTLSAQALALTSPPEAFRQVSRVLASMRSVEIDGVTENGFAPSPERRPAGSLDAEIAAVSVLVESAPVIVPALAALATEWRASAAPDLELPLELRRRLADVAAANALRLRRLRPVLESFESRKLRWAALKGLDHLARLYPDLSWRPMGDVDVLVHPDDLAAARMSLEGEGFRLTSPRASWMDHALGYHDQSVRLDLHRSPCRRWTHRVAVADLLEATSESTVDGAPVRLFAPAAAFLAHALVLGRDRFSPSVVHGGRLVEIALLEERLPPGSLEQSAATMAGWRASKVFRRARELSAWVRGEAEKPVWWRSEATVQLPGLLRWTEWRERARLQDGPREATRYLAAEVGTSLLRIVTLRRLGVWI
jgi:hypothetical protein